MNDSITERCRKNQTVLLKHIVSVGQSRIADRLGLSESTISRYKDTEIERFCAFCAAAGVRFVDEGDHTIAVEDKRALLRARMRMDQRDLDDLGDTQPGDL